MNGAMKKLRLKKLKSRKLKNKLPTFYHNSHKKRMQSNAAEQCR
jgi:hypothetical protein